MNSRIALCLAIGALSLGGCNTMEGIGTDIARGGQKIQNASHEVRQQWRAARERNDREYEAARSACAGAAGDRVVCLERAQAQYSAHMDEARRSYPRSGMPAESDEDRREDAYDVARDRCELLRGADEDRCIADARARYGY